MRWEKSKVNQHGARPCMEKMQLIFFVPPNEELDGTLHPQKFGCTPKNEGKRVHVPPVSGDCIGRTINPTTIGSWPRQPPWENIIFHHFVLKKNLKEQKWNDITEILLKVALNTLTITHFDISWFMSACWISWPLLLC
jgi:hypothetical protein